MASRAARFGITMSASLVAVALFGLGFDEPRPASSVPAPPPIAEQIGDDKVHENDSRREIEARLEKLLDEERQNLKPLPPTPVPDNPPPHEGAMIDLPWVVEPPDFIMVQVLEALPGRPISGVRLVRPDGTISLGFYGDINVRGLTIEQVKTRIILHLRTFMNDQVLGLLEYDWGAVDDIGESAPPPPAPNIAPAPPDQLPDLPRGEAIHRENAPQVGPSLPAPAPSGSVPATPQGASRDSGSQHLRSTKTDIPRSSQPKPTAMHGPPQRGVAIRRATQLTMPSDEPAGPTVSAPQSSVPEENSAKGPFSKSIQVPPNSSVKVTVEVSPAPAQPGNRQTTPPQTQPAEAPAAGEMTDHASAEQLMIVPPAQSSRVYVDMDSYNSKHYYVLGDVPLTGRYGCTGNDTILDVQCFVGGFLPSADPNDIRVLRPARGEVPARVYHIDWKAVSERSDKKANLQILPGDRIYFGRSAAYKTTATQAAPARQPQRPAARQPQRPASADQKKK